MIGRIQFHQKCQIQFPYCIKSDQKKRDSKEAYNVRKKLVAVEEEEIKTMEQKENNSIQRERNKLLKQFLTKM